MELSVIIPVFNEEKNLDELFLRLDKVLTEEMKVTWELIFVEDGYDNSWEKITQLARLHPHIRGFKFSRNFGHQYALQAGLDMAKGEAVITMDADLQHPPSVIKELYCKWKEGSDIVYALRKDTLGVSVWKKWTSALFYKFINAISDIKIEKGSSDFRLLSRRVVDELKNMQEYYIFLRGMVRWVGFDTCSIEFVADERFSGKTKYHFRKMFSFAWNGITSFSTKPLRIATLFGITISFFSFIYIIYALLAKFAFDTALPGWTSLLISILFLGGIQLFTIGIIGEYIGKMFMEIKKRPNYIISKTTEKDTK